MSEEKTIPTGEVEAIAARVLVPGNEMFKVYRGLFEALMVIERRLDAVEQKADRTNRFVESLALQFMNRSEIENK